MFYDIFSALCAERGITKNKASKEIGLSNSTVTKWKRTSATPDGATLAKISKYFGVSMDFLLGITPESSLMVTRYQLSEAKKDYEKETDGKKREQLALAIDVLSESLDDQLLTMRLVGAQKLNEPTNAELLQNLRDEERALLQVTKGMTTEQIKKMAEFAKIMKGTGAE